jgi:RNA polymerase sigma-70 factor (ECF subfamily)
MEAIPSPELEIDLVVRATAGELPAFEELVCRYQRAIFNVALYKSRNYFDAEDLTQDIFLAAFKALGTLKTPESFGAWLFGIAYNRCHKWYQRERNKVLKIQVIQEREARKERLRQRSAQGLPAPPGLPGESSGSASASEHLSEVLLRLPAEVRETLTLKYLEGLSYQEIEKRLGINAHRIDYLIRKGKQLLRERAPGLGGGDPA